MTLIAYYGYGLVKKEDKGSDSKDIERNICRDHNDLGILSV